MNSFEASCSNSYSRFKHCAMMSNRIVLRASTYCLFASNNDRQRRARHDRATPSALRHQESTQRRGRDHAEAAPGREALTLQTDDGPRSDSKRSPGRAGASSDSTKEKAREGPEPLDAPIVPNAQIQQGAEPNATFRVGVAG